MTRLRLCINTQTPVVRFKHTYPELMDKYDVSSDLIRVEDLKRGEDYDFSPGGVTAMVYPVVKRMLDAGIIEAPSWISLGPGAPREVTMEGIHIYNVSLEQRQLAQYANFKEGIWNEIHGLGRLSFKPQEYMAYVGYNWNCAQVMLQMLGRTDIFWIHDFQQLIIGNMIGPSAPAILRWHIPFKLENVSDRLTSLVLKNIEGFDAIVVSTRRDLEGLIHAGYRGKAYAQYPYLDPDEWRPPTASSVDAVKAKLNLREDDRTVLVVARMDPVKSQDIAIRATSVVQNKFPKIRLVLAGNGSFTGSSAGGLGHPKSAVWRSHLENLTGDLRLKDRVVFTGHLSHEELNALYSITEAVVVPSNIEGFNLTAVEGWLHEKPCVVSRGAGVSELIHDDVNGYTFAPSDDADLASKLAAILSAPEPASKMGQNGAMMAKLCFVDNATQSLKEVFEQASKRYA